MSSIGGSAEKTRTFWQGAVIDVICLSSAIYKQTRTPFTLFFARCVFAGSFVGNHQLFLLKTPVRNVGWEKRKAIRRKKSCALPFLAKL